MLEEVASVHPLFTPLEKKGIKNLYVVLNDVQDKFITNAGYGYGYYVEDNNKSFSLKNLFRKRKSEKEIKLTV